MKIHSRATFLLIFLFLYEGISVGYCGDSVEMQLRRSAAEAQKSLPMMVAEDLQATSIAAVGKILMSKYNFTKRISSIKNLDGLKAEYFQNAINGQCTNPETVNALRQGVSFIYDYYDSENKFVMRQSIDMKTCGH